MKALIAALPFVLFAGCASTTAAAPIVDANGRAAVRTIHLAQPVTVGAERLIPQTLRNTIRSGKQDVFLGEVGGLTWPYTGAPIHGFGLCLDQTEPAYVGLYTPHLPGCLEVKGVLPPVVTIEPR